MDRRDFLKGVGIGAASYLFGCQPGAMSAGKRPNVVLILADDLGYGDVSCFGSEDIKTPAIDSIAAEGVRFVNCYSNGPECSPTRTGLLTGRYQQRVGGLECAIGIDGVGRYDDAMRLAEKGELGLPVSEVTIARILKDAGYRTAIFGKWHLGYEAKFNPLNHGFDYWFGPAGGGVDYFHHCEYTGKDNLYLNRKIIKREGYLTDLITDEAVRYIDRAKGDPFFLYVPYTAPHTPYQGPGDKKETYVRQEDYNKGTRKIYIEMVERMDEGIGRILGKMESSGVSDNTLVIFVSDNGANSHGNNSPFRGYKGNVFEGGIHVPACGRWPGRIKAGAASEQVCITMDFAASIVRAAGGKMPKGRKFDGIDIIRHVEDGKNDFDRTLFWRARRGDRTRWAVRKGDLKYIRLKTGDKVDEYFFDLSKDISEKDNLLDSKADDVRELKGLLDEWEVEVRHRR